MADPVLDYNILRVLSSKRHFTSLRESVPEEMLDPNTQALLQWFDKYFREYPEHECIEGSALLTLIKLKQKLSPEMLLVYERIVRRLDEQADSDVVKNTSRMLEELAVSGRAQALLERFHAGDEIDITFELSKLASETAKRVAAMSDAQWADDDPSVYLERTADEHGLKFPFPIMQHSVRGLQSGHNIAIAAPTNSGKTSLLCFIAAAFAEQNFKQGLYPDRPILYLVNEGTAEEITPRVYQSVLQLTLSKLRELARTKQLIPEYEKRVGSRRNAIRVVNIHGMHIGQVLRVIEAHNPYCVITDMTGRIYAQSNQGSANDVGQVEFVWNTLREQAAVKGFLHIGTIQISAEGFDMLYPPISALQNSKVGVQTTLNFLLTIGQLKNNPQLAGLRGFNAAKNKLAAEGYPEELQFEVQFSKDTNTWDAGTFIPPARGEHG